MKKVKVLVLLVVISSMLSGCYWSKQVEANEVGLDMPDGVKVHAVNGPGRYRNMAYYAELQIIDCSAKTVTWEDPDLVTKDKQPIGFTLSVSYARKRDMDSAIHMWNTYNSEARNDESLQAQVLNRIPRVAKALTTKFTLDEQLGVTGEGGRVAVQNELFELLAVELAEIDVELLDVGINNIAPSPEYLNLLEEKANATVAVEVAAQQTLKLQEQLLQEQAQTEIDLEKARRERLVAEEAAKVFTANDRWFELQKLERLADVFGDNDKFFFIDPNTNVTLLLSGESIVPVPTSGQ